MRSVLAVLVLTAAPALAAAPPPSFDAHFTDATLRVDLIHAGNAARDEYSVDRLLRQGIWAGSRTHLVDPFGTGQYEVRVVDPGQRRGPLLQGVRLHLRRVPHDVEGRRRHGARLPRERRWCRSPRHPVRLVIERRDRDTTLHELFSAAVDPADTGIIDEPLEEGVIVVRQEIHGDPHAKVDVAVLGEGYTAAEEGKFRADLARFTEVLFGQEPYRTRRGDFNVYGVLRASQQSGCDEPSRGVHRATALDASFDSLGSERYLLTENNRAVRDAAAHVPYDTLLVMVNSDRYGGGGIYNLYCTFTSDNQWATYLLLHELGHAFAGLADEYYTSSVAYNEFYPKGVEPTEANITALLDPAKLKWKDLVTPGTPVPTPWEKAGFDEKDLAYQKVREELNSKIAAAMRSGAPAAEVARLKDEAEKLSLEHAREADAYLAKSRYVGVVGAFEGAGYASTGLYRPMLDCIMFSKGAKPYCAVCSRAIERVIDRYTE